MDLYLNWLTKIGFSNAAALYIFNGLILVLLLFVAWMGNMAAKAFITRVLHRLPGRTRTRWDDFLMENRVLLRISHVVPALILYLAAPTVFGIPEPVSVIRLLARIYMFIVGAIVADALLDAFYAIYNTYEVSRRIHIRGFIQVMKILVFFVIGIQVLSLMIGKSPAFLFTSLGAMTAVLMLIFKDSIMGLVAGIQMLSNDMVRMGDWIEMPRYGADGAVIDISLTTVKIQNWDMNIVTIPTYAMISDSFKNWRGMQESGGRRIMRSVSIDMSSIRFLDDELLERLKKIRHLGDYLDRKLQEIAIFNDELMVDDSIPANGRRLTNIGTFRAYLTFYLQNHMSIRRDMTLMVRQLPPTEKGLCLEIYCFSKDQRWVHYEGIQADIFDHILAVLSEFDLKIFQNPSGSDIREIRLLLQPDGAK